MLDQKSALLDLFKLDQFLLIVLDDCRFDTFQGLYAEPLGGFKGALQPARSPGSCTPGWARAMLQHMPEGVLMITANPGLGSGSHFWQLRAHDHFAKIINAWDGSRWDPPHKRGSVEATPPKTMAKLYSENCDWDRTIVWFIQPHGPYMSPECVVDSATLRDMDQTGNRDVGLMRRGYRENLIWALPSVADCIRRAPVSKVVVTADHGEAFGEQGIWGHPGPCDIPVLRIVPWLEINK